MNWRRPGLCWITLGPCGTEPGTAPASVGRGPCVIAASCDSELCGPPPATVPWKLLCITPAVYKKMRVSSMNNTHKDSSPISGRQSLK